MIGKTLAHFEVVSKIGEGGMGEVWQARDTKLGRDVALKILPPSFLQDPERLARFRREARVLASLNHPNIASIYGLEEDGGRIFLVMELAAGEDLSERLARGAFSGQETLAIAKQIVAGLEEAHENGVVHRDLKPANIKLSDDGKVKILDFGLARAWADDPQSEQDLANSPTITAAMTQAGVILGTAAYMSPEQARGKVVDRRADIWSLGVILFEMLTGERLFEGETVSDTLAGVLKTDVDLDRLPDDTPDELRWLIGRALQRQPANRLRDVGEARIALEGGDPALSMSRPFMVLPDEPASSPARTWLLVGLALVIGAAGTWFLRPVPEAKPAPGVHAALLAPPGHEFELIDGAHIALSPDGGTLAFVASDSLGNESLWVRRLGVAAPYQLSGTENANYPFWSPDGSKIGFFAQDRMRKIDVGGGVATTICPAQNGRGGSWMGNDRILFAPSARDSIFVVSAAGGAPAAVTGFDKGEVSHRWPDALPGGHHFLATVRTSDGPSLFAWPVEGGERKLIIAGVLGGRFDDGHIFFGRDNALWARPFDPVALEFTGEEFLVADAVVTSSNFMGAGYSASDAGNVVLASAAVEEGGYFVALAPDGREEYRFRSPEGTIGHLSLSPDEKLMLMRLDPTEGSGHADLWIRDLRRETLTRVTTNEQTATPRWSPTGDRIAYIRDNDGTLVFRSSRGAREVLLEAPLSTDARIHDWSRDGQFLMVTMDAEGDRDVLLIPVDDPANPVRLTSGFGYCVHGGMSPDGKWLVHMSTHTGRAEVYLLSTDPGGDSYQVSTDGGVWPSFSPDGSSIYFVDFDNRLRVVEVDWSGDRPELGIATLHRDISIRSGRRSDNQYIARQDGGFYYMGDTDEARRANTQLDLIVGWRQLFTGGTR